MEFKKIRVPFIGKNAIKNKADFFREKYWGDKIPVDIEKIIDVKLKIDIIPVPALERLCNTDALISSDWQSIYVDEERFNDERYQNRLRFSLAHEIGHFILHKEIYSGFNISSFEDFYNFINEIPGDQYGYLETQAHKFSSFLLVPRDKLLDVRKNILNKFKQPKIINCNNIDSELLNSYIAGPIGKIFGVSSDSMEIVLSEFSMFNDKNSFK